MKRDLVLEDLQKAKKDIEKLSPKELEEGHKRNKRIKKIFIRLSAIFLILLMISFLYLSAPVYTYVYGIVGSSKLNENNEAIFKNQILVRFNEETLTFLQELYNPLGDERAVCLLGEKKGNTYEITSYYKPVVFDRAWNMVSHEPCSQETLIMLHTHPLKRCNPSRTDKNTLRITQHTKPDIIMLVMCGNRRFSAVI